MHQSILTYGEFVTYIRENVEAVLNEDREAEVVLTEVEKNNGVMSEIMTIRQERENFAPVFYMRDIYEQYLRGISPDDLAEQMVSICRQQEADGLSVNGAWFEHFENVREHIILKAVNYESNCRQLSDCPFIKALDLAVTFRVLVEEEQSRIGTVLVSNEMMKWWHVSETDLYKTAAANMQRLWKDVLEPIQDMVHEMAEGPMAEAYDAFLEERPETETMPLYVLTNEIRLNGASVLFYTDCLKRFASDIGRDFFVLPSSIHEVLLLPVMDEMSAWDLRQIVGTMNHQVVSDEEVLSDHVYRYLHKCNKLIIAA